MYQTVNLDSSQEEILKAIRRFEVRSTVFVHKSDYDLYETLLINKLKSADFKVNDYTKEKKHIEQNYYSQCEKVIRENIKDDLNDLIPKQFFEDEDAHDQVFFMIFNSPYWSSWKYLHIMQDYDSFLTPNGVEQIQKLEEEREIQMKEIHLHEIDRRNEAERKGFVIHFVGGIDTNRFKHILLLPKNHIIIKMVEIITKRNKAKLRDLLKSHPILNGIGKTPEEVAQMVYDHILELDKEL